MFTLPGHAPTRMSSSPFCVIAVGLLCVVAAACQDEIAGGSSAIVRDSAGVRIVENRDPAWSTGNGWTVDPEPTTIIGSVEGDPNQLFNEIVGATRLSDGRILVLDSGSAELRFYDADGQFLNASGGRGGGPGEFSGFTAQFLSSAGDTLTVLELPSWSVVRFNGEGAFIDRRLLDRSLVAARVSEGFHSETVFILPGGGFMAPMHEIPPRPEPAGHRRPGGYLLVPSEGEPTFLQSFPSTEANAWLPRSSVFGIGRQTLAIADNAAYDIAIYTPNGELRQRVRNTRPALPVLAEDLAALKDRLTQSARSPEQAAERARAFDSQDHAETFPAFSALLIDRLGHLWVRAPLPVRGEPDTSIGWDIYDPEGIFLGEIFLPLGLNILDVGEDYILGVMYDMLGVERVHLHSLRRG